MSSMHYFKTFEIDFQDITYRFTGEDLTPFTDNGLYYWHRDGDPSTWLVHSLFDAAKKKCQGLPPHIAEELAAGILGITVEQLQSAITWVEEYMRWHDGG